MAAHPTPIPTPPPPAQVTYKTLIMGDSSVGKTSVLTQYMCNNFESATRSTIGVDYMRKDIVIGDTVVMLQLWDTAGQERCASAGACPAKALQWG